MKDEETQSYSDTSVFKQWDTYVSNRERQKIQRMDLCYWRM